MGKASKAIVARRVAEVLHIRLQGAMFPDVLQYVAEKSKVGEEPWKLPDGAKPFAERTIWWYIHQADKELASHFRKEAGRKRLLRRHQGQRRYLYAAAVSQGDVRAALACLDSEAKLCGLFDDELTRQLDQMQREIEELKAHAQGDAPKTAGADESGPASAAP